MSYKVWKPKSPNCDRDDAILLWREKGNTYREIAEAFGISRTRVQQIIAYAERQRLWHATRPKA